MQKKAGRCGKGSCLALSFSKSSSRRRRGLLALACPPPHCIDDVRTPSGSIQVAGRIQVGHLPILQLKNAICGHKNPCLTCRRRPIADRGRPSADSRRCRAEGFLPPSSMRIGGGGGPSAAAQPWDRNNPFPSALHPGHVPRMHNSSCTQGRPGPWPRGVASRASSI
jgi:hypothetical protein